MPVRIRKLIGTVLLIILVIVYAWLATTVAVARLGESGPLVHLLYFLLTGLLWILPAMWVIKWMVKEPKPTA
jgi:cation transporter-like permease